MDYVVWFIPFTYSEGANRDAISIFLEWMCWTDQHHHLHACAKAVRFQCQIELFSTTISFF